MNKNYFINWPKNYKDMAINGSTISYQKNGEVYFSNALCSPGKVLVKWRSKSDFVKTGIEPTLPLLRAGTRYSLVANLTSDRELAVKLQLVFLDINNDELETVQLENLNGNFTVPTNTVSYEIRLLNLHHTWLKFKYLEIQKVEEVKVTNDLDASSGRKSN